MRALVVAFVFLLLSLPVRAQAPICRPWVYENIPGQPPIGSTVMFSDRDGDHMGIIRYYYVRACWPGIPVMGLNDIAFDIDYGRVGPIGNEIDVILNRDQFDVVGGGIAG